MALYFEGTSTGNRYEVGKTYEMGGREYTAQADGSFVREGSRTGFTTDSGRVVRENDGGHSLVGSSQDPTVRWYASGADSLSATRHSPGSAVSLAGASARSADTGIAAAAAQGGGTVYRIPSPSAARFNAAAQDYVRSAAWSGKDDPPQDQLFAGLHLRATPTFTNAELGEARYSDFMSSVIGIPIFGADIGNTLAQKMGQEYYGSGRPGPDLVQHRMSIVAAIADDKVRQGAEAAFMGMMTGWDAVRGNVQGQLNQEARARDIARELQQAYDRRDELERAEEEKRYHRSGEWVKDLWPTLEFSYGVQGR